MCINPIKIKSPKLAAGTFLEGVDKRYLCVPCGHCEECQDKRTKDLIFRAYHEYLFTVQHKGFVLFQTLTYSSDNIPNSEGFYYFCKKDVQKFIKRLRKRLRDLNYLSVTFKYLVTCEYGDKGRPHYHVLFYVLGDITTYQFDALVNHSWSSLGDVYTKSSKIGRTDERLVDKRIINSIYGIKYVCKYIFKGTHVVEVIKKKGWSKLSQFVHDVCFVKDSKLIFKDLQDWQLVKIWLGFTEQRPELKQFQLLPFYLQSKNFGVSFLEDCCYEDLFDIVVLPSKSPLGFSKFQLPNYYIRKVFYDYDPNTKRYIINQNGIEYKKSVDDKLCDDYYQFVSQNNSLNDTVFQKVFPNHKDFFGSFSGYVAKMLKGRSLSSFIHYCVFLKDRPISPHHIWLIPDDTYKLLDSIEVFSHFVADDNYMQMQADTSLFVKTLKRDLFGIDYCQEAKSPYLIYNTLPCFSCYDSLYDTMVSMRLYINNSNSRKIRDTIKKENNFKLAQSIVQPQNAVYY